MNQKGKKRAGSCGQPSWWPSLKSSISPRGKWLVLHLWWILSPEGRWWRWVSSIMGFHTQKPCSQNQEWGDPIWSVEAGKMFPQNMAITNIYGGKGQHKRLIITSSGQTLSHTRGIGKSMSGTLRPWQGVQKRILTWERIHMDMTCYMFQPRWPWPYFYQEGTMFAKSTQGVFVKWVALVRSA